MPEWSIGPHSKCGERATVPRVRIPVSPQNVPNPLNIRNLEDFYLKNGTKPGHSFSSLYDALTELCKEKKMMFFKPTPYVNYLPAKLSEGKINYIHYSVRNPDTGKMKRYRIKMNRFDTKTEMRKAAKIIMAHIDTKLALGWNPATESAAPRAYTGFFEAIDTFIAVKSKELEENSLRSYRSYVKILKGWLLANGYGEMNACDFTKNVALAFIDDVEKDTRLSAKTFNNYVAFYRSLFTWLEEKGYVAENVFDGFKKKPRRLTVKTRRIFNDEELRTLFDYLGKTNPEYLAMCILCYGCLMRPKEIALLKWKDMDLEGGNASIYVRAEIAKNDHNSYRTIPEDALPYLRNLRKGAPEDFVFSDNGGYDFKSGKKRLCSRKLAKYWSEYVRPACGFPDELQFYSLKDTGITNMTEAGIPISIVQQQADHSSVAMTAIYMGHHQNKAVEALQKVRLIK